MRMAYQATWERSIPPEHQDLLEQCLGQSSLQKNDLAVLWMFTRAFAPRIGLEIGLATGSSAVASILAAGASFETYVMIDPYQGKNFRSRGIETVRKVAARYPQLSSKLIEQPSYVALPQLLQDGFVCDYAFIDGSHKFDDTLLEVYYIDKMLVNGGVIILDDRPWPMVGAVVDFLEKNYVHYVVDCAHPRLTFLVKQHEDRRRWYDFEPFRVPVTAAMAAKIADYQRTKGSAFSLSERTKRMRLESLDEPSSSPQKCESRYSILKHYMKPGDIGAEIGVFKGAFVEWLLLTKPSKLYLVDPWYRIGKNWHWAKGNQSTVRALSSILDAFAEEIGEGIVVPRVEFSQEFLQAIPDDHLDWVYIDSTHGYEQTRTELTYALRKVKPNGFIMGDDYTPDQNHPHHGVYRAVKEFESAGLLVLMVDGEGRQFVAQRAAN